MKSILSLFLLFTVSISFGSCLKQSERDVNLSTTVSNSKVYQYQLSFTEKNIRKVEVQAQLEIESPMLTMDQGGIPSNIAKGWAHFVTIASITDTKGNKIDYKWLEPSRQWELQTNGKQEILLKYEVELKHDSFDWSDAGGIDARPTVFPGPTLFWITKGLFIVPDGNLSASAEVSFKVPEAWAISTAWVTKKGQTHTYIAENVNALSSNALMLGHHTERIIQHDNMTITLAITAELQHRSDLFLQTLETILPIYKTIFSELPTTNYLICASAHVFEDGEAYNNSFHQIFVDQDLEARKIVWANVLAHEMFHYWNGTNFLVGQDIQGNYWFSEGFTEYYANLALVRAKVISMEAFQSKLAFQFSRYFTARFFFPPPRPNFIEAGYQKGRNWALLYGGGSTIAFILDVEIRSITNGKKSLDDFMRHLYFKYGKTHQALTTDDLIKSLKEVSGQDFTTFFNNHISGNQLLPLLNTCKKAGLRVAQYQGEFYLSLPNESQDCIFKNIVQNKR